MLTFIVLSILTVGYFGAVLWLARSILSILLSLQVRHAEAVVRNRATRRRGPSRQLSGSLLRALHER